MGIFTNTLVSDKIKCSVTLLIRAPLTFAIWLRIDDELLGAVCTCNIFEPHRRRGVVYTIRPIRTSPWPVCNGGRRRRGFPQANRFEYADDADERSGKTAEAVDYERDAPGLGGPSETSRYVHVAKGISNRLTSKFFDRDTTRFKRVEYPCRQQFVCFFFLYINTSENIRFINRAPGGNRPICPLKFIPAQYIQCVFLHDFRFSLCADKGLKQLGVIKYQVHVFGHHKVISIKKKFIFEHD